jgi:hypothetical protein
LSFFQSKSTVRHKVCMYSNASGDRSLVARHGTA